MSTFMANPGNIERKWYVIDAADKPLGRVADKAAALLRGKHKATYTPHQDCGDHVIIINDETVVLTGAKLEQKYYRHHTCLLYTSFFINVFIKESRVRELEEIRGFLTENREKNEVPQICLRRHESVSRRR